MAGMNEELQDFDLLQALARDVESNFSQLVYAYGSRLYGYLINQVKDAEFAQDIMQDCWLRIFQALNRMSEEEIRSLNLRPWLFAIVHNRMDTLRKKKQQTQQTSISIEDVEPGLVDDETPNPEDILKLKELVEEVRAAIGELPPTQQPVLTLLLFEGASHQEIALSLGQSVGTIRTRAFRGMKLLREKLATKIN